MPAHRRLPAIRIDERQLPLLALRLRRRGFTEQDIDRALHALRYILRDERQQSRRKTVRQLPAHDS